MGPAHELLGVDPRQVRGVQVEGDRQPNPPRPVGPIPTWAVTVESEASSFRPRATASSPEWKLAAYPIANSCSVLVPGSW